MRSFLAVAVVLSGAVAEAQSVCTFSTATLSSSLSSPAAPTPPLITGAYSVDVAWDLEAVANPNVSCANLASALGLYATPAFNNDAGATLGAGLPTSVPGVPGAGTTPMELDYGGRYIIWGEFACSCGILGTYEQPVASNPILVPPSIFTAPLPQANLALDPDPVPLQGNSLPVGDSLILTPVVQAVLCPGDTLSFSLTGAGVNVTTNIPTPTECTMNNGFSANLMFTPTEAGTLTLTATLDGAVSNAVTYNVVVVDGGSGSSTSSTTGGTTGSSSSSSSSKGGGCTVVAGGFSLWGLLSVVGSFRRRERGPSRRA